MAKPEDRSIFTARDEMYMRRALQLAAAGRGHVAPNPMVGAVIVAPDGRIIGEGWHRRYGSAHAEVNAVASVADVDRSLLSQSTIYVTLEPCSHYGKTPPCAKLLIETGFKRVISATVDPNPLVAGRGLRMLAEAGIDVLTGLLEEESRSLNKVFFTAHTQHRPFTTLKWAESADGYMAAMDAIGTPIPTELSSAIGSRVVHYRRAIHEAIAIGARTALTDRPSLTTRYMYGSSPRPIVFDRHATLDRTVQPLDRDETIHLTDNSALTIQLADIYTRYGITSVLVEGGAALLQEFIHADIWDEAYIERSERTLGASGATKAPTIPGLPISIEKLGTSTLYAYRNEHSDRRN